MRMMCFFAFVAFFSITSGANAMKEAIIVTYAAPESEIAKTDYKVSVNGKNLDIYPALSPHFEGGEYYFTYFDFEGEIEVKVESEKSLENVELHPARFQTKTLEKNSLSFTADKPFHVSVLRDGRNKPLMIFGNPLEKDVPKKDDPNVIYFGAGVHELQDGLELKSNQTLYLAGGCVLKTFIKGKGENITVRGRGILSCDIFKRFRAQVARFDACKNLIFNDIIIKDPMSWIFVVQNCDGVSVDNLKICGSRMLNDDAVDICNTKNVSIKNTFCRTQDDIIAVKGMRGKAPCENIVAEDCIFWTDVANIFRIGYECEAEAMRNMRFRNIDIPFYSKNCREPSHYWANCIIWLQPTNDMPIHDVVFENLHVRSDGNDMIMLMAKPFITNQAGSSPFKDRKTAGSIRDCSIKNLDVTGKKGDFTGKIFIAGHDAQRKVENLIFENVVYFGEKTTINSLNVEIHKEFTNNIIFK